MCFDDALGDGQPQPYAAARLGIATPEAIEDPRNILRRNADAGVRNFESHHAPLTCRGENDAATGRREADGIRAEIREDPGDPRRIDEHRRKRRSAGARDRDRSPPGDRLQLVERGVKQLARVAWPRTERQLAPIHRRSEQQVRHDIQHLIGGTPCDRELSPRDNVGVVFWQQALEHEIEHRGNGAERIAKIVCDHRDDEVATLTLVLDGGCETPRIGERHRALACAGERRARGGIGAVRSHETAPRKIEQGNRNDVV